MKKLFFTSVFLIGIITGTFAQNLYSKPAGVKTKWASPENPLAEKSRGGMENFGRKGRPSVQLLPGDTLQLAFEPAGTSGIIRRIWMTIGDKDALMQLGLKINFYWDGEEKPAVSAPLGYFFGMGLGEMYTFQSSLFSSPEGKSYNCYIPMPFRNGMKILLINETPKIQSHVFYDVDYTTGDKPGKEDLYFHAYYKRTDSTKMREDYEFLPLVKGSGRYLGVNFGVAANTDLFMDSWWGEGEVKVFLDGDKEFPSLCGTGTEDYIGTGWGQGQYDHLYQGSPFADHNNMRYCFYRYHVPDPVYFDKSIRITIHQIGCCYGIHKEKFRERGTDLYETGNSSSPEDIDKFEGWLFERYGDDWASCVYFYLDKPVSNLPEIDCIEDRILKIADK